MKKFRDCSTYIFISKFIEEKLNSSEDINKTINEKIKKCFQEFLELEIKNGGELKVLLKNFKIIILLYAFPSLLWQG